VEIHAYCVMVNHVYIHLRTREANLSAYMRSLLTRSPAFTTTATTPADMFSKAGTKPT
jgi:REP element-mobilizing transposase RayT